MVRLSLGIGHLSLRLGLFEVIGLWIMKHEVASLLYNTTIILTGIRKRPDYILVLVCKSINDNNE